jgi:hypothetical protein
MTKRRRKRSIKQQLGGLGCVALLVAAVAIFGAGRSRNPARSESTRPPTQIQENSIATLPKSRAITGQSYAVFSGARLLSCTQSDCELIAELPANAPVLIDSELEGEAISGTNTLWYRIDIGGGQTAYIYSDFVNTSRTVEPVIQVVVSRTPTTSKSPTRVSTERPVSEPTQFVCPRNCDEARAQGLTAQQAGQCPNLDRDNDGLACYDD